MTDLEFVRLVGPPFVSISSVSDGCVARDENGEIVGLTAVIDGEKFVIPLTRAD